jgi:hypothetical protein
MEHTFLAATLVLTIPAIESLRRRSLPTYRSSATCGGPMRDGIGLCPQVGCRPRKTRKPIASSKGFKMESFEMTNHRAAFDAAKALRL